MESERQKKIIKQVKDSNIRVGTVRDWNASAKELDLPSSSTIINEFGSWKDFKGACGVSLEYGYTYNDLLGIAQLHKEHLTSRRKWDDFASKNSLPRSQIFIDKFSSWNNLKHELNLPILTKRSDLYTKEDIVRILKQHGANLESRQQWDVYAHDNNLPAYKTLRKHFTWEEILKLANRNKISHLTRDDLIEISIKHYKVFSSASIAAWNKYARDNKVPSSYSFIRNFGSWKKAKVEITKLKNALKKTPTN
ncbi:hypothetical protein [Terribacillus sp. DMT04]|uniref:hypothetical protein n=1 Tax=Terribacillus sp. DMT04 TaxID=2850441 RepID=UPI001C2B93B2|nr:hypothetical protein [Terribacillus sp. DMT04]QXE03602.1 hypothetical protein KS242_17615 [Terribacillus sp. DMT04]